MTKHTLAVLSLQLVCRGQELPVCYISLSCRLVSLSSCCATCSKKNQLQQQKFMLRATVQHPVQLPAAPAVSAHVYGCASNRAAHTCKALLMLPPVLFSLDST